jgi:hypothetical protein
MSEPVVLQGPPRIVDLIRDGYPRLRAWEYDAQRGSTTLVVWVVAFELAGADPVEGTWRAVEPTEDA